MQKIEHRVLLTCTVFRMLQRSLFVLYLHDQCLSVGYVAAAAATFPPFGFHPAEYASHGNTNPISKESTELIRTLCSSDRASLISK